MTLDATLNLLALVLSGALAATLAAVLRWFASPTAHAHYRQWAAAWAAQASYYLLGALSFGLAMLAPIASPPRFVLSSATQIANVIGAALLVIGAVGYVNRREFSQRQLRQVMLLSTVVGIGIAAISLLPDWRSTRQIFRGASTAAAFLVCGWIIYRNRSTADRPERFLGLSMLGFGIVHVHYAAYAVLSAVGFRPPYSLGYLIWPDIAFIAAIVSAMITLAFADQQREAAIALRARETEFRQLIEHSSDLLLIVDREFALCYASPSTEKVLGWSAPEIGASLLMRVHPDDQAILPRCTERTAVENSSTFHLRLRHERGSWLRVEAIATCMGKDGDAARIIINARDISERERLEATLHESQKLESLGRVAGGVAHDLNNILTVIGGNTEVCLFDASESAREPLQHIEHATKRATELTRQLLSFARRQVVAPRRFDAWDAVSATTSMAARLLPASVDLRVRAPGVPHVVLADPGQIEQVVMNLIVNARDAIIGDGTIDVELDALTLTTNSQPGVPPGRYVTITVRDSGAGISDFVRAHLFEPFFTTKALGEGTGLGLATSYGLVKQAGGFIQVDSALGVGSSFRIFLPLADATLETLPEVLDGIPEARNERLLLVEDDPEVRVLMAGILRRVGYHVSEAANGIEALAILDRGERVDVVVSDVVMPRMGGVELSRAIRQRHADLGIVLVSGYPGDTDFVRSLPERASFLQKPFQSAELAAHVRRALPAVSRQP